MNAKVWKTEKIVLENPAFTLALTIGPYESPVLIQVIRQEGGPTDPGFVNPEGRVNRSDLRQWLRVIDEAIGPQPSNDRYDE